MQKKEIKDGMLGKNITKKRYSTEDGEIRDDMKTQDRELNKKRGLAVY